jgi:hypothetical protein
MVEGETAGGYTISDGKPVFESYVDGFVTPSTHQAWGNGGHGESILEVIKNNPYVIQRLTSSKAVFIRKSAKGGSTWSDWKSISLS